MPLVDILAFAPHPDDVELSCGGSVLLAVHQGLRVAIADMSAGEMASRGTPEERERECKAAGETLGVTHRVCLGLPDTRIGTDPDHRRPVIDVLLELRPRVVLAPYWTDRHPDHAAAGKLVGEACYFSGVRSVAGGTPHRPQRIYYYAAQNTAEPSFVVDVSSVWERRMAAVKMYRSQFSATDDGFDTVLSRADFLRFIEARGVWYGAMIGAAYGEAFITPGPVPLSMFPDLIATSEVDTKLPPYTAT